MSQEFYRSDDLTHLNKEAQELMEIFNTQLEELASEGNSKVVTALITLGHIMGKDVQILREEHQLFLRAVKEEKDKKTAIAHVMNDLLT